MTNRGKAMLRLRKPQDPHEHSYHMGKRGVTNLGGRQVFFAICALMFLGVMAVLAVGTFFIFKTLRQFLSSGPRRTSKWVRVNCLSHDSRGLRYQRGSRIDLEIHAESERGGSELRFATAVAVSRPWRPPMLRTSAVLLAAACLTTSAAAEDLFLYVSPTGNDAWTGRLDAPNADRTDGPFATPQRALDAVLAERRVGNQDALRVLVREGTYFLDRPLAITPEHCIARAGQLTISGYPDEHPVISGGVKLTPLQPGAGGVWQTTIPEVAAGKLHFRHLWVNGRRAARPRLPETGNYALAGGGDPDKSSFIYAPGHIDPAWRNRDDIEVVVLQYWTEARLRIAKLDEAQRLVTFTGGSWRPLTWSMGYYVENVAEALEQPGQWYLDRPTGVLRYIPLPGEDPAKLEFIAPVLEQVVRIEGTPERPVSHVDLAGLHFAHCAWSLPPPASRSLRPNSPWARPSAPPTPRAARSTGARSPSPIPGEQSWGAVASTTGSKAAPSRTSAPVASRSASPKSASATPMRPGTPPSQTAFSPTAPRATSAAPRSGSAKAAAIP